MKNKQAINVFLLMSISGIVVPKILSFSTSRAIFFEVPFFELSAFGWIVGSREFSYKIIITSTQKEYQASLIYPL